tara:strand:+ start:7978 stop:8766 length:789 start_codon:yes stop_codon:yes gene_type:complete
MDNKMKGIIGGVVGLVVILIIVFSMGSSSITPQQFAKETLALSEKALEKVKAANSKEDLMNVYKETLPPFLDMIPGAIAGANEYLDEKGGAKTVMEDLRDGPSALEKYSKDFEEVMGKGVTLSTSIQNLMQDRGFQDRMEKIFESMTDLDYVNLVQFTIPEFTSLMENIASNDDALAGLNAYIALMTPETSLVYDEKKDDWVETKISPVVLSEDKLLSLSKIISDAFKDAKSERDFERAADKIEEAMEKEFGEDGSYRLFDF